MMAWKEEALEPGAVGAFRAQVGEVEVVENIAVQEVVGDKPADPDVVAAVRKAVVHRDKIEVVVYGIEVVVYETEVMVYETEVVAYGIEVVAYGIEVAVYGIEGMVYGIEVVAALIESADTRGRIRSHSSEAAEGVAPATAACEAKPRTVNKHNFAEVREVEVVAADEQEEVSDNTVVALGTIAEGRTEGFAAAVEDSNLGMTAVTVGDLVQAVPDKYCFW